MRIIITESQLYNLLPRSLKRRMSEEDFVNFDNIVQSKKQFGTLRLEFGDYRESVLQDALGDFVNEYKMDIPYGITDDNRYMDLYDNLFDLYWGLLPYLRKRYQDELYDYYINNRIS